MNGGEEAGRLALDPGALGLQLAGQGRLFAAGQDGAAPLHVAKGPPGQLELTLPARSAGVVEVR